MTTLKSDEHSGQSKVSVLEQVKFEQEMELQKFEYLIFDTAALNVFVVTAKDDEILRFYDFVIAKLKGVEYTNGEGQEDVLIGHLNNILSKLEDLLVVQNHLCHTELTPEEEAEINETVSYLEERQRHRKMGPVRKLVHNIRNKIKKQ